MKIELISTADEEIPLFPINLTPQREKNTKF